MATQPAKDWDLLFHAFWGARAETPTAVASRLIGTMEALDGFREALTGRWVDDSGDDLTADTQAIVQLVTRSIPRTNDGKAFAEQGFRVILTLVPVGQSAFTARKTLSVEIGAGSALVPRRSFFNRILIRGTSLFPERDTFPLWPAAFTGLVAAWQPEYAALLSREQRRANESMLPDEIDAPWIGAITYLSERTGALPAASAPARVDPTSGGAVLYLSPDSPADAVSGTAARDVLRRAATDGWHARIPRVGGSVTERPS
ncbi:Imm52 family immunity protein [Microbacterium sp. P07]|uniref:Imm52 family immunity protein n=1 Tax=Microbacterium sp. P07 TaxID=3366952 RepID=UPI003746100A